MGVQQVVHVGRHCRRPQLLRKLGRALDAGSERVELVGDMRSWTVLVDAMLWLRPVCEVDLLPPRGRRLVVVVEPKPEVLDVFRALGVSEAAASAVASAWVTPTRLQVLGDP